MYNLYSKQTLLNELYSNVLTVIFKKTDGSMRKMRCTLLIKYLPIPAELPDQRAYSTITVWDLEENGWRRFRVDAVQTIIKEFESDMPVTPVTTSRNDIRKSINRSWTNTADADAETLDKLYDEFNQKLRITDDATLYYLIYWNNGYSGPSVHALVPLYKAEMVRRGKPYTEEIASIIEEETAMCE